MESAAFKKLTEQLTEIVQYVRLAKMAFQENLTGKGLKPMLTNDDAAKMLGVSKRYNFGEKPGPISKHLYDTLRGIQYGTIEDKHGWTTVVIE